MAKINGVALLGALRYLKESDDPAADKAAILSQLPAAAREVYDHRIVRGSWYPYVAYGALLEAIDRRLAGDRVMADVGRFLAGQDVRAGLKFLAIFTSIEKTLPWSHQLWPRYCDTGRFETAEKDDGMSRSLLHDFPDIHPCHCELLRAWFAQMCLEMGAASSTAEHPRCVHTGDGLCEFVIRWRR